MFDKLWGMEAIHAPEAWNLTTGSTKVVVADNDTGVDYTHPDLYKNIWINQPEIPRDIRHSLTDVDGDGLITFWDLNEPVNQGPGKITDLNGTGYIDGGDLLRPLAQGGWADGQDNGNNGFVDDLIGWDFFNNDNDPMDVEGRGTGAAGTIGALGNNGVGVVGINWKVQIMPVKMSEHADVAELAIAPLASPDAMMYAAKNGARVAYHGYKAPGDVVPQPVLDALVAAAQEAAKVGQLMVTAAGQGGTDNDVRPFLPSGLDFENIIAVAGTNKQDRLWSHSNYGGTSVDLGAPAAFIWTTDVPGGDYGRFDNAAFGAAHVAGAAALILARNPTLSYAQVKALILDNVGPVAELAGKTVTGGRLNLFKAVSATPVGPSAAGAAATGTGPLSAEVAALDVLPRISINDVSHKEGNKGFTEFKFAVTLSRSSTLPVTVSYATADGRATSSPIWLWGADYLSASGSLTFATGETRKTITFMVQGDRFIEGDEVFYINLSNPINAVVADGQAVGTIQEDNDQFTVALG
jgi:hypothetical protein